MKSPKIPPKLTLAGLAVGGLMLAGCSTQAPISHRATENYAEGVLAYQQQDTALAKEKLGAATRESPDLIKARTLLGDLFRADGDYRAALDEYETVVKLDPNSPTAFFKLGLAYQFLQRFLEARNAYERSLVLNPDDADAQMNLGLVHLALGELPQSMEHARRAVELAPKNPTVLANYGVVLDAVGDHVGAEHSFLSSLEITGDTPSTLLNLGQNLLIQNRPVEAQEVLQRFLKKSVSPIALKRLGDAYSLQGKAAEAIEEYERALKLDPNYYPALNDAGRIVISKYRAGAELDENLRSVALSYWQRSLKINPDQPTIQALVLQWSGKKP
jgi:tetratricopeptide (TPR) repeat protein